MCPESQCGFRRGCSCTDAIFCVRQLVEKCYEHRQKGVLVFVDLRKAYDSVPREALWSALSVYGIPPAFIALVKSFHTSMEACVRLNGCCSESVDVRNGLRQGCVMAPVLFNLFFGLVREHWQEALKVSGCDDGISLCADPRHVGDLFPRQYRRSRSCRVCPIESFEFADDAVLLAPSRAAAVNALSLFCKSASAFGLTVSASKTKFMVVGHGVVDSDRLPLDIDGMEIECVESFVYLGSVVSPDSRSQADVKRRLANAARAFRDLQSVFSDRNLSVSTKRYLYTACVSSVLLYGSECWTPLKADLAMIDAFHHRAIRAILCVSRRQQRTDGLTNLQLRRRWGDERTLSDVVCQRRLEWLGHVARMPTDRHPQQILFGSLCGRRPFCGPRRRWRDVVNKDLKRIGIQDWFARASDRPAWRNLVSSTVANPPIPELPSITCQTCDRTFRRPSDIARHKCSAQRRLPVSQQAGARLCSRCQRWFRSPGGLAVHNCLQVVPTQPLPLAPASPAPLATTCCSFHCPVCNRCFRSRPGFARHNCNRGVRMTSAQRVACSYSCNLCSRRFSRHQDLTRHQNFCR